MTAFAIAPTVVAAFAAAAGGSRAPERHIPTAATVRQAGGVVPGFAIWEGLVPGLTEIGDPTSASSTDRTTKAWPQVFALLRGGLARLAELDHMNIARGGIDAAAAVAPATARPVSVFGFSKGAVVLTRMLKELAAPRQNHNGWADLRVAALHWVDPGLARAMGVYPTARDVAAAANSMAGGQERPVFVLHGSPRQWGE